MTRAELAAACAALVLLALRMRPAGGWYEDLMVRTYARDHIVPSASLGEEYDLACGAAAGAGLPVGWTLELLRCGVAPQGLRSAASKTRAHVLRSGPPASAAPEALAKFRRDALEAGAGRKCAA